MQWMLINLFLVCLALVSGSSLWVLFRLVRLLDLSNDATRILGVMSALLAILITGAVARWTILAAEKRVNRGA